MCAALTAVACLCVPRRCLRAGRGEGGAESKGSARRQRAARVWWGGGGGVTRVEGERERERAGKRGRGAPPPGQPREFHSDSPTEQTHARGAVHTPAPTHSLSLSHIHTDTFLHTYLRGAC